MVWMGNTSHIDMIEIIVIFLLVVCGLNFLLIYLYHHGVIAKWPFVLLTALVNSVSLYFGLIYIGFSPRSWLAISLSLSAGISAAVQVGRISVKAWETAKQQRNMT